MSYQRKFETKERSKNKKEKKSDHTLWLRKDNENEKLQKIK
jgi:hypothetical protein